MNKCPPFCVCVHPRDCLSSRVTAECMLTKKKHIKDFAAGLNVVYSAPESLLSYLSVFGCEEAMRLV